MTVLTHLWTDGSGMATGGPGGWAFVLQAIDQETGEVLAEAQDSGGLPETTNQRAELTAVIEGLLMLQRVTTVTVFTDSEYVMHGFTNGWVERWRSNGWLNREGKPVANRDLWETLAGGVRLHRVSWQHVKGHKAERRCACGWTGPLRNRKCPKCGEKTTRHDLFPLNARCDELAGAQRRKLLDRVAAGGHGAQGEPGTGDFLPVETPAGHETDQKAAA